MDEVASPRSHAAAPPVAPPSGRRPSAWRTLAETHAPLLAALVAALPLVAFLWTGSLVNSDDAIYADMARTAFRSGNWLDFYWHGAVLHEKPPILFWLVAASGGLLGFSDLAVRLPVALLGAGVVGLVVRHARRLGLSTGAALLAGALTLASGAFYFTARRVMTDVPLLFFGLVALDAWWDARLRPRRLVLFGAALGAAVLTKWVAAAPFALVALVDGVLPERNRPPLRLRPALAGLAAFLVIAAPWHVAQSLRHGSEFWSVYAGYHVVGRAGSALVGETSPLFYVVGAWVREGGLALLWVAGLLGLGAAVGRTRGRDRAVRWLAVWAVATLVPIHLAETRLYHYLVPAVPVLALAFAWLVERFVVRPSAALLALVVALGLGATNNAADLLRPDYAPGTKRLAAHLAGVAMVAVVDTYDVAATWYGERPVPLWTTSPALAAAWSVDMLRRADAVRVVTPEELAVEAARARSVALLTLPESAAALASWLPGATVEESGERALVRRPAAR